MNQTVLIKIGGSTIESEQSLKRLGDECRGLLSQGYRFIFVHGGGKAINKALQAQQIQSAFINGLRVTTSEMMETIEMILSGHVNKMIVRMFNSSGIPAIGLSGVDNQLLLCRSINQELGYAGHIEHVNIAVIQTLLNLPMPSNLTPIISPIGVNPQGQAFNVNADSAACQLACALTIKKLIYLTDTEGIYDQNQNLLEHLDLEGLQSLIKRGIVTGGMLAKVNSVIYALTNGVEQVQIISGKNPQNLTQVLNINTGGTICQKGALNVY